MKETPYIFDGPCPSCEDGTMKTTRFQNYRTKIKGVPFVVPEAYISVCDKCDERMYSPQEKRRWEVLYEASSPLNLPPAEITALRERLGLNITDFAHLLGATRQSVTSWEKAERQIAPGRTAALMMRLVKASLEKGSIDVIDRLLEDNAQQHIVLEVRRPEPEAV